MYTHVGATTILSILQAGNCRYGGPGRICVLFCCSAFWSVASETADTATSSPKDYFFCAMKQETSTHMFRLLLRGFWCNSGDSRLWAGGPQSWYPSGTTTGSLHDYHQSIRHHSIMMPSFVTERIIFSSS